MHIGTLQPSQGCVATSALPWSQHAQAPPPPCLQGKDEAHDGLCAVPQRGLHKELGCPLACTAEPPVTGTPWAGGRQCDGKDRDTLHKGQTGFLETALRHYKLLFFVRILPFHNFLSIQSQHVQPSLGLTFQ